MKSWIDVSTVVGVLGLNVVSFCIGSMMDILECRVGIFVNGGDITKFMGSNADVSEFGVCRVGGWDEWINGWFVFSWS